MRYCLRPMSRLQRDPLQNGTFLVMFVLGAYLFWRTLEPIWIPVFLGLTIAVAVFPLQERMLKGRLGRQPGIAAALLTALVLAIGIGILFFLVVEIGRASCRERV